MKLNIDLPNKNLQAEIPTTWNAMTAAQCAHVLNVFAVPLSFMGSAKEAFCWKQIQILKALANWTDEDLEAWQEAEIKENGADGILIFLQSLQTVCDHVTAELVTQEGETDADIKYNLSPKLTVNPYKKIEIVDFKKEKKQFQSFYAPKSTQENPLGVLDLDELSQIFTLWERYRDEKDEKDFDQMLAILYRPKKSIEQRLKSNYNGDIRQKLEQNEKQIHARAQLLSAHVTDNFRIVIDFHIASCREAIALMYPSVFGRKEGPSTGKTGDWLDLIIALADDDFSKKESVMDANAHDTLAWADRIRETMKVKSDK